MSAEPSRQGLAPAGLHLLHPARAWPAQVGAAFSLRHGGASQAPWDSLNLGAAVGDDAGAVRHNRALFGAALGVRPVWLQQVHGTRVLRLRHADVDRELPPADAAWTDEAGLACTVLVADCLAVLLSAADGRAVAAAHAGWRGLAGGVIEASLQALREGAGAEPQDVHAWLSPCIGAAQFEVGADVLAAFGVSPADVGHARFVCRPRPDGALRWLADLPGLASDRLRRAGVSQILSEDACTVEDPSRFFSFRRDGVTGRMAAAVWRRS